MEAFTGWLANKIGLHPELQSQVLTSVLIVFSLWIGRKLILRIVSRRTDDSRVRYQWQKSSSYVAYILGMFLVGRVWLEGFRSQRPI